MCFSQALKLICLRSFLINRFQSAFRSELPDRSFILTVPYPIDYFRIVNSNAVFELDTVLKITIADLWYGLCRSRMTSGIESALGKYCTVPQYVKMPEWTVILG